MTVAPRRGRPPTGRKIVLQVPLDAADHAAVEAAAAAEGETVAEVGRRLIRGETTWKAVQKAARSTKLIDRPLTSPPGMDEGRGKAARLLVGNRSATRSRKG